jgi:hypothetical protein
MMFDRHEVVSRPPHKFFSMGAMSVRSHWPFFAELKSRSFIGEFLMYE